MPYRYIEIEFQTPDLLFDLVGPTDVYTQLLSSVDQRSVSGANFNKYYHARDIPRPRIDFRVNLEDVGLETAFLATAQRLQDLGKISGYSSQFRDWNEPGFVVRAHETATSCALAFKTEIQRRNLFGLFLDPNSKFVARFLRELFRQAGGDFYIAWTYLRAPDPTDLAEIVRSSAQILEAAVASQPRSPDFLERFVHCFINNIAASAVEQEIMNWVISSSVWSGLAHSWASV